MDKIDIDLYETFIQLGHAPDKAMKKVQFILSSFPDLPEPEQQTILLDLA
mgnify:CR=1 FL=1